MMRFDVSEREGVVIVALDGEAMGGPDGSALLDKLHALRLEGRRNVVVDLGPLRAMNSSGLGMLIAALSSARNGGGDLRLAAIGERVHTLLVITRLTAVFQQFATVDEAVKSFGI
ncbi:MAG TPA: STAS domain-containing protein [Rhodothermales bacterium]|nr:STAS domain-containing protein [Rhodothermales bacterium]